MREASLEMQVVKRRKRASGCKGWVMGGVSLWGLKKTVVDAGTSD